MHSSGNSCRENADSYPGLSPSARPPGCPPNDGVEEARIRFNTVIARRDSAEAIQSLTRGSGLLRGACHPAALRADRVARNDDSAYVPFRRRTGLAATSAVLASSAAFSASTALVSSADAASSPRQRRISIASTG